MRFFRKKEQAVAVEEPPKKPSRSLQEIVHERVLTAEGWQRRTLSKAGLQTKKKI